METNFKKNKGITLVALVITIIVLLILAGVTISLTFGENGILKRTQEAKQRSEESSAREKLELVIGELSMLKKTDKEYDEKEYINKKLEQEGIIVVEDDIVVVDGWKFEIDRKIPKVGANLGKGEINTNIKLELSSQASEDYVKSTITAEITYEEEITNIYINEKELVVPEKQDGKYILNTEVTENGKYTIMAQDKNGKVNIKNIIISEITEDMDIYNRADMEKFRDMVNAGRTFEGKTARVMDEIYLEGSEENKWTPIGDYAKGKVFKGTFEGNGHTINNVYINSTLERVGLFGQNTGNIKNVIITGSIKSTANYAGGIAGASMGNGTVDNCTNKAKVTGNEQVGGIIGSNSSGNISNCINEGAVTGNNVVGGITGSSGKNISNCTNKAAVTGNEQVGGVVGSFWGTATTSNCINEVAVTGTTNTGGISGACWDSATISNCVNKGAVTGNDRTGGITGTLEGTIEECSNQKKVYGKHHNTGGIVGYNSGNINKCSNISEVYGYAIWSAGIAGQSVGGTLSNLYNRGPVKGNHQVGGIVGTITSGARISYTYNAGDVSLIEIRSSGEAYAWGGIAGQLVAGTTCEYSYNVGSVYGNGNVGGIVGENRGNVLYCYNSGQYTSTKKSNSYLGPIRGYAGGRETGCQSSGTMPTIYSVMSRNNNTNWVNNTNNLINGGYPILQWEQKDIEE